MVFTGKPSTGCRMCRSRRVKCDENKPACSRCTRTGRTCPGYRNALDLVFRNETGVTAAVKRPRTRAPKQQHGLSAAPAAPAAPAAADMQPCGPSEHRGFHIRNASLESSDTSDTSNTSDTSDTSDTSVAVGGGGGRGNATTVAIIPALQAPPDQLATCHFFSNFVLVPSQGTGRGFMDFLVPLMRANKASTSTVQPLTHAFDACALASMGSRVVSNSFDFSGQALAAYTRALAATHVVLKDPERACDDATLAVVLLLSLFETITAKQAGMFAWGSHVEGAIELVRTRGRDQLKTKIGLSLFIAVRTQMIIHSATSGKPSKMSAEWWLRDAVSETAAAECQRLSIQTAELREAVNRCLSAATRTPDNTAIVYDLAQQADTLDRACAAWGNRLPPAWQPQTVAWEEDRRIDVYSDVYIASVWNMLRCARLALAAVTVRCAAWDHAPADYRTTPEYAAATRACSALISDIIAAVPFHFGWHLQHQDIVEKHYQQQQQQQQQSISGAGKLHPPSFVCGDESDLKGLAGYFLAWPLASINIQDYTSDTQRAWAIGRLRYIADEIGVRYAGILAGLQLKIPSMLIRRDRLMTQQCIAASHEKQILLSTRTALPVAGYSVNPLQQWEALQKQSFENDKAELLAKASGKSSPSGQLMAKNLLQV